MTNMQLSEKSRLILSAYELLYDVTPKKYDCGALCSSACCKENTAHGEGRFGMLLLPGEEELLSGSDDYEICDTDEGKLLVCTGSCVRDIRPFACRIFPFYPEIIRFGNLYSIKIKKDPRSLGVCPIYHDFRKRSANVRFYRNTKRAVRILMRDGDIRKELISQSELLSDIEKLRKKLLDKR